MPISVAELFNKIASKAGIPADHQAMKDILSNAEISKIMVPDTLSDELQAGLYNLESARAKLHPVIKAETLNLMDAEILSMASEFGIDEETAKEIKSSENTSKRIKALAGKIKDLEGKKAGADKGDKAEYTKQINDLKAQMADAIKAKDTEITQIKAQSENEITQFALRSKLASFAYALDNVPKDVNILTANQLLTQSLSADDAVVAYDKTTGQMKLVKKDGTDFYDKTNNKVDFNTYTERVLAQNKLLKVSDPSQGKDNSDPGKTITGTGSTRGNTSFSAALDAQLADATNGDQ